MVPVKSLKKLLMVSVAAASVLPFAGCRKTAPAEEYYVKTVVFPDSATADEKLEID